AVGVISTQVASYIRPEDPARFTSVDQRDVFQWGSVPYDEGRKAFGFKPSWRAPARMRERLESGPVRLKVTIASTFSPGPNRMLIAEIPGTVKPSARILVLAHHQKTAANS